MKCIILGHKGMLGHVVLKYFLEKRCEVECIEERYDINNPEAFINKILNSDAKWIINACGKIKQKSPSSFDLYQSNTLMPIHVVSKIRKDQYFIHASTDCVFSGEKGNYSTDSCKDATDSYGLSKSFGESVLINPNAIVIRSSIIGPELGASCFGLFEWVKMQKKVVNGFANHFWNGITTLQWAKEIFAIIKSSITKPNLIHLVSNKSISKFELLMLIKKHWNLDCEIIKYESAKPKNMILNETIVCKGIEQQLVELKEWYSNGKTR